MAPKVTSEISTATKARKLFNLYKDSKSFDYLLLLLVLDKKLVLERGAGLEKLIKIFSEDLNLTEIFREGSSKEVDNIETVISAFEVGEVRFHLFLYFLLKRLHESSIEEQEKYFNANFDILKRVFPEFQMLQVIVENFPAIEKEELPELFEECLTLILNYEGRSSGEYSQPPELTRFICAFADLPEDATVFNPFAGLASFGIGFGKIKKYVAQDMNERARKIGLMRLIIHGLEDSARYFLGDSVNEGWWPVKEEFDIVVAHPPFGGWYSDGEFRVRLEEMFFSEAIGAVWPNGRVMAILPDELFSQTERLDVVIGRPRVPKFFQFLDYIDTVVSLPSGILRNTNVPVSLIVTKNDSDQKGVVRFVDGSDCFKERQKSNSTVPERILDDAGLLKLIQNNDSDKVRVVPIKKIEQENYSFNLKRYFLKEVDGVSLGELGEIIRGERDTGDQFGKCVRIKDLKNDRIEYELNASSLESSELPRYAERISGIFLLLTIDGISIKPTLCRSENDFVYFTPNIVALRLDETKIDIGYLINELHSDYVKEQLAAYRISSTLPRIRKEDLMKIKIKVPEFPNWEKSLSFQKRQTKEINESIYRERIQHLSKIHGLEKEVIEQNIYLRHALAGPLSNLTGSIEDIIEIVENQLLPVKPEVLMFRARPNHTLTFSDYLKILKRDIGRISNEVSNRLKMDQTVKNKVLAPINIIRFLTHFVSEVQNKVENNFEIEFTYDKDGFRQGYADMFEPKDNDERIEQEHTTDNGIIEAYINGNEDLLNDLFNNLLDNAKKHAFQNSVNNRIEIYLMKDMDSNEITILFSNTGNLFPEDFYFDDFIRKGSKAGISAGDGYGGYYINEIVRQLNGRFDIIDEQGPEGLGETDLATTFELIFPIIENEE